jgi:hypothetical protein
MKRTIQTWAWIGVAMVVCVSGAWGQLAPVNVRAQQGRALDANIQTGSGGANSRVNSQSYNSGTTDIRRTRGLSGFRGRAPSLSNELGVTSIDRSTSRFRRMSVGLEDMRPGSTSILRPQDSQYDPRLRTTLRQSDILEAAKLGMPAMPGRMQEERRSAAAHKLYAESLKDYSPLISSVNEPMDARVWSKSANIDAPRYNLMVHQADAQDALGRADAQLFALSRINEQQLLAQQLREAEENPEYVDQSVKSYIETEPIQAIDASVEKGTQDMVNRLRGPDAEATEDDDTTTTPGKYNQLPQKGQDAYFDLMQEIRDRDRRTRGDKTPKTEEAAVPERRTVVDPTVMVADGEVVTLRRLSGDARNPFTRCMAEGQKLLKKSDYYGAVRQFRMATIIRRKDPMAYIGSMLATFGTGEFSVSAVNLDEAIAIYPALLDVRIDIKSRMNIQRFDLQLKDLDSWIENIYGSNRVLFLAIYLNRSRGNLDAATRYAKMLQKRRTIPMAYKMLIRNVVQNPEMKKDPGTAPKKPAEKKTP